MLGHKFWVNLKLVGVPKEDIIKKKCGCIIPKGQFVEYGLMCNKHRLEITGIQLEQDKITQQLREKYLTIARKVKKRKRRKYK